MAKAGGYILNVIDQRREVELKDSIDHNGYFSEAVPAFDHSRNLPLVCFISFGGVAITHIGYGQRGVSAATGRRRLNVNDITELNEPIEFSKILPEVAPRAKSIARARFEQGGILPPKTFEEVVDAVSAASEEARRHIARFGKVRRQRIERLSGETRKALAEQKDAVTTALGIAGVKRDELQAWEPPAEGAPESFLEGLSVVDLREDQMILNDLSKVPGFDRISENLSGIVQFEDEHTKLKVVIANRTRLEEQLGVNLIYYNETYDSFVMVQYKAMEDNGKGDPEFRLPNNLLAKEVARMEKAVSSMTGVPQTPSKDAFRLLSNPFFLKFCPRLVFNPDDKALVPGMYLTLDHWKLIEKDPTLAGPKGGLRLTYENVGRYMNNTGFIDVVRNAWVGTTPEQSKKLRPLIEELVKGKRAVVLAVKSDKPRPRYFEEDDEDVSF